MMMRCSILLLWLALGTTAQAENRAPFELTESQPLNEVWFTPGFYSWHFEHDRNLENSNPGLGVEYRYATDQSVLAGRYYNSDRLYSNYITWLWQPLSLGNVRLGALAGALDGYPRANQGGWFVMAIPVASYEFGNIGVNLTIVPTIPDTVHGSITLQLKVRVF